MERIIKIMTTKPTAKNIFIGNVHTEFRKSVLAKRALKVVSFIKELNKQKIGRNNSCS